MAAQNPQNNQTPDIHMGGNQAPEAQLDITLDDQKAKEEKANQSFRANERTKTSSAWIEALNTPKGKTFTTALITILIVALLIFFAISPALSSITAQLEKNKQLSERIATMDQKIQDLNALSAKEVQLESQLEVFESYFGEDKHQDAIFDELKDITADAGMSFISVSFSDSDPNAINKYKEADLNNKLQAQDVKLVVTGRLDSLTNLIEKIEGSTRILDVETMSVSKLEVNNDEEVQVDLLIKSFFWEVN